MKIEKTHVQIKDLVDGYLNSEEEGVVAFGGLLNVRPKYQREFVYKPKQRNAVIDTVLKGFPLNTMYWVENEDGTYEVLDGQQRTISICEYATDNFSYNDLTLGNLKQAYKDIYDRFMNYELDIYICKGSDSERLNWFKTINIAGEKLTDQELRNINYTGQWLTHAKRYFSKENCPAENVAKKYMNGTANRQELLEKVLIWATDSRDKDDSDICKYMSKHANDNNAYELINYFEEVMDWVKDTFDNYYPVMKKVEWGFLYNDFYEDEIDTEELNDEITRLMADESVTNQKGIYRYVFNHDEAELNIRKFSDAQKQRAFAKQKGVCPICKEAFPLTKMEAHHKIPWSLGGKTEDSNCELICKKCHKKEHAIT